jgi:hypothetical protein
MKICAVEGCGRRAFGRGWCGKHYARWLRHGDPLLGRTFCGEPERFLHEVVLPYKGNECVAWPYARDKCGYAHIWCDERKGMVKVTRLICEEIHGPPPTPKHQAAHTCGKGHLGCVTPAHLIWKTPKENEADKITHGTACSYLGEHNGRAKLTDVQVLEIRAIGKSETQQRLAERYVVSPSRISEILSNKTWRHI